MPPTKPTLRSRIEAWLHQQWYVRTKPNWFLAMLVPLYQLLRGLDHLPYRMGFKRAWQADVPVWVIGNLTIGGTGKTPLVIALVQLAKQQGVRVGVISRGYGGSHRAAMKVHADSDWQVVGDEPLLIARATQVPVAVARRRADAAKLLQADCDLLICDDGLQHQALARDLEVLLIDGQRRFGNRALLPAGPLREPIPSDLHARFAMVVCNGPSPETAQSAVGQTTSCEPNEVSMQLTSADWQSLDGQQTTSATFHQQRLRALAGIGNPERFFSQLRAWGLSFDVIASADHQAVEPSAFADCDAVLMTEKDALKYQHLAPALRAKLWYLPIHAQFSALPFAHSIWTELSQRSARKISTRSG
jgi:tetraacyldisaccharide 4'-kinase